MPDVPDLAALREAGGLLYLDALVGDSQHIYVRRDVAIKATDGIAAVLSLVDDLRAENERLREAVVRFGHHHEWCAYRHDGTTCGCGLHAALAGSPAANEEQQ